jgi:hypothetical protein
MAKPVPHHDITHCIAHFKFSGIDQDEFDNAAGQHEAHPKSG